MVTCHAVKKWQSVQNHQCSHPTGSDHLSATRLDSATSDIMKYGKVYIGTIHDLIHLVIFFLEKSHMLLVLDLVKLVAHSTCF